MKIEANGFGRFGVAFVFATEFSETAIYEKTIHEKTRGDGLNLRPND
jgi:hypothetical protein